MAFSPHARDVRVTLCIGGTQRATRVTRLPALWVRHLSLNRDIHFALSAPPLWKVGRLATTPDLILLLGQPHCQPTATA